MNLKVNERQLKKKRLLIRYNGLLFRYNGLLFRYSGILLCYSGLLMRYNGLLIRYDGLLIRYDGSDSAQNFQLDTNFKPFGPLVPGLHIQSHQHKKIGKARWAHRCQHKSTRQTQAFRRAKT